MSKLMFGKQISKLQLSKSPEEREELLSNMAQLHAFSCHQLGVILSHLHYSSERIQAASLLSPVIVDPENVYVHVLPFIAFETQIIRQQIIDNIIVS